MEDFTRMGYCIVAGSFVAFQFSFSALSPQLSLSLSPSYCSLPSVKQSEWNSRCVSTLHAVIVGLFCLYILWYDDAVNANPIWGDPWLVKLNVAVTCGYLLYDLLLLLRYWKTLGDSLFVCHHLAALYAYGYVLSRGVLPYFANFRLLSELSTPFVNLRWFLDAAGWPRTSSLVLANGLAMMVAFFVVRIAVIPSYYLQVYSWKKNWPCSVVKRIENSGRIREEIMPTYDYKRRDFPGPSGQISGPSLEGQQYCKKHPCFTKSIETWHSSEEPSCTMAAKFLKIRKQ